MIQINNFIGKYSEVLKNFSYITLLQFVMLLAPLITYPYLVRVLGMDLYGYVITAQVLASYASLIIDFGSNSVCAKHVSINREYPSILSEILTSVFFVRGLLWFICFLLYVIIVFAIPAYRQYWLLFVLTYGWTLNDLLFPQYFFQGLEKLKESTIINISIKIFFIVLVFFVVHDEKDVLYVPILYSFGYAIAGFSSIIYIYGKLKIPFCMPSPQKSMVYVKDSFPIFATDMICTIKDKFSYFLLGATCGMNNVVVYDLGLKINSLLTKPVQIISTVVFPRFAKSRNVKKFVFVLKANTIIAFVLVILTNIFLRQIVGFFIEEPIDINSLRIFTLAPLFLSISSCIASDLFVAFGYNKYMLYSIVVTTGTYLTILIICYISNQLSVYSFIIMAIASYFAELVYRCFKARAIISKIS